VWILGNAAHAACGGGLWRGQSESAKGPQAYHLTRIVLRMHCRTTILPTLRDEAAEERGMKPWKPMPFEAPVTLYRAIGNESGPSDHRCCMGKGDARGERGLYA